MKTKDMQILSMLRKDARVALTMISKNTQIPVSTISDRIRANVDKFIIKHTSLLDFNRLGYAVRAHMLVKADLSDKARLRNFLVGENCLNSVFGISNGFDFVVEGVFKQTEDMDEFIERMKSNFQGVQVKSYFIIEDFKRESFMIN